MHEIHPSHDKFEREKLASVALGSGGVVFAASVGGGGATPAAAVVESKKEEKVEEKDDTPTSQASATTILQNLTSFSDIGNSFIKQHAVSVFLTHDRSGIFLAQEHSIACLNNDMKLLIATKVEVSDEVVHLFSNGGNNPFLLTEKLEYLNNSNSWVLIKGNASISCSKSFDSNLQKKLKFQGIIKTANQKLGDLRESLLRGTREESRKTIDLFDVFCTQQVVVVCPRMIISVSCSFLFPAPRIASRNKTHNKNVASTYDPPLSFKLTPFLFLTSFLSYRFFSFMIIIF
ncbi:hypothetical protein QVD17_09805 [Tagetes erecta]|uniref:Uncharacterized protein n=1 Tax=Tagetes erecta TaxID=13708 RepID=A0AAD8P5M5_TARER|nr:hypothetical protein QVD17_09805 [Tagetes erecta]